MVRKAWLRCDKGGKFIAENFGKRSTSTRKTQCPFEVVAQRDLANDQWALIILNSNHNHPPTVAGSHPIHRKIALTDEIKNTVAVHSRINSTAKQILKAIHLDTDEKNPLFKARDVYNQRAVMRYNQLGAYNPVQALMMELNQRSSWFTKFDQDIYGRIIRLFFARTSSQKILRLNHEVLIMECTYKTNAYRMHLCIINGVIPLNTTFYVVFCFLSGEKTADYSWLCLALEGLHQSLDIPNPKVIITDAENGLIAAIPLTFGSTVQHLLCLWHINKNVVINCKKWFINDPEYNGGQVTN